MSTSTPKPGGEADTNQAQQATRSMAMQPSAAKRRRHSPPELGDDLISEILLRLPPDNPALLVRFTLVCKPWRRLLTDPAFLPRFRAFHQPPPMLGFFCNVYEDDGRLATFVPTSAFCPPDPDHTCWLALDARHSRVLFQTMECALAVAPMDLVVWDPITDEQWGLPLPGFPHTNLHATVLCAASGCHHLDCHGGPFLVVFVGTDDEGLTSACVHSSEAGEWSEPTPAEQLVLDDNADTKPAVLVGNALYFICELMSTRVLEYDLGKRALSVIDLPLVHDEGQHVTLMVAEDGELGFARLQDSRLYLWSRGAGTGGIAGWAQRRVIELGTLLPVRALVGFADGVGVIFVRSDVGVFTIELKSGRVVRKVSSWTDIDEVIPYMSFYTPVAWKHGLWCMYHAGGIMPPP